MYHFIKIIVDHFNRGEKIVLISSSFTGWLKRISWALFIGVLLNEIGAVMDWLLPDARNIFADSSFIDKNYVAELAHKVHDYNLKNGTNLKGWVTLPYFFYELAPYLYIVIIFFCWILREWNRDKRLARILTLFLGLHISQSFFYWYDRNTSL